VCQAVQVHDVDAVHGGFCIDAPLAGGQRVGAPVGGANRQQAVIQDVLQMDTFLKGNVQIIFLGVAR
jgi:hypothetical protein